MPGYNAMVETFEEVTILNKPALFTPIRIDHSSVPRGYHVYSVRHDDDSQGIACQVAKSILMNHWGDLITQDELKLPPEGYLGIEPEDLRYGTGDCRSVKEFIKKYPCKARPAKNQER
jgi:hypothetical protein